MEYRHCNDDDCNELPDGMNVARKHGFSTGADGCLTGLSWGSVGSYAAELSRENGDVYYRGQYVCTSFNDADGGDQIGANGRRITDAGVQRKCRRIDCAVNIMKDFYWRAGHIGKSN